MNVGNEDLKILLPGVPCRTSRGWLGYCTVALFPLDGRWALFDTGHYSDRAELMEALGKAGVDPKDVGLVVLSHLHFDHVLNLPLFPHASVAVSAEEIRYAEKVSSGQIRDPAIPEFWHGLLQGRKVHRVGHFARLHEKIELMTLPGHTPGCMAMVYGGSESVILCGDVIKNAWDAVSGVFPSPETGDDPASESIRRAVRAAEIIVPGHDRPFRFGADGIEYLASFQWTITGNFFPQPKDRSVLKMDLPPGFHALAHGGSGKKDPEGSTHPNNP